MTELILLIFATSVLNLLVLRYVYGPFTDSHVIMSLPAGLLQLAVMTYLQAMRSLGETMVTGKPATTHVFDGPLLPLLGMAAGIMLAGTGASLICMDTLRMHKHTGGAMAKAHDREAGALVATGIALIWAAYMLAR